MAKPTVRIPVWASGGSTTDPGAGKEATGWLVSERPPANWINWAWNSFGQWLGYFEDWTDTAPVIAYGKVSTTSGNGTEVIGTGAVHISGALSSTNQLEVIFDVEYVNGWTAWVQDARGAGIPYICRAETSGGSPGSGGAGTRSLVILPFYDAGGSAATVAVNPTNTNVDFYVTAVGSIA